MQGSCRAFAGRLCAPADIGVPAEVRLKAVVLKLPPEAALTFAGVWEFETGLRAVQLRGELMEVEGGCSFVCARETSHGEHTGFEW